MTDLTHRIARAWAHIDGRGEEFDQGAANPVSARRMDAYLEDARELLRRSGISEEIQDLRAERDAVISHIRLLADSAAESSLTATTALSFHALADRIESGLHMFLSQEGPTDG